LQHFSFTRSEPFFLRKITVPLKLATPHMHDGIEIGSVVSESVIMFFNERRYELKKGDAYFLDSMTPHGQEAGTLLVCEMDTTTLASATPTPGDLRLLAPFIALRKGHSPVVAANSEIRDALLGALKCLSSDLPEKELWAWPHIVSAFTAIAKALSTESAPPGILPAIHEAPHAIITALNFIQQHATETIGIPDIAEHCCLSTSRIAHLFSDYLDISPIEYRNRLRIGKSIDLLEAGKKVDEVAGSVGFSSVAHFNLLFKRYMGTSPRQFKAR
jgi:AraC-like DNA-binding protein